MSSLPLRAGNSPSFPSQIRQERLGDGEIGEYWDGERERDEQQTTEEAVSTALAQSGREEVGGGRTRGGDEIQAPRELH